MSILSVDDITTHWSFCPQDVTWWMAQSQLGAGAATWGVSFQGLWSSGEQGLDTGQHGRQGLARGRQGAVCCEPQGGGNRRNQKCGKQEEGVGRSRSWGRVGGGGWGPGRPRWSCLEPLGQKLWRQAPALWGMRSLGWKSPLPHVCFLTFAHSCPSLFQAAAKTEGRAHHSKVCVTW